MMRRLVTRTSLLNAKGDRTISCFSCERDEVVPALKKMMKVGIVPWLKNIHSAVTITLE